MQKVIISTESTADIPANYIRELGIVVLPVCINVNGTEYLDGVSFTCHEFYQMLEEAEHLPTTAQISPYTFMELYEKHWKAGYTDQVHLSINSKGSGTYSNAVQAISLFYEEHPEAKDALHVHVIDSAAYSMVYGWPTIKAARMAKEGASAEEIVAACEEHLRQTGVMFIPMSLKFIKKSGRISGLAGFVGDALGLKPVISFEDGVSKTVAKIRGEKKLFNDVLAMTDAQIGKDAPYLIAYGSDDGIRQRFREACEEHFGRPPEMEYPIGSVIAINSGHNTIAIIFKTC